MKNYKAVSLFIFIVLSLIPTISMGEMIYIQGEPGEITNSYYGPGIIGNMYAEVHATIQGGEGTYGSAFILAGAHHILTGDYAWCDISMGPGPNYVWDEDYLERYEERYYSDFYERWVTPNYYASWSLSLHNDNPSYEWDWIDYAIVTYDVSW